MEILPNQQSEVIANQSDVTKGQSVVILKTNFFSNKKESCKKEKEQAIRERTIYHQQKNERQYINKTFKINESSDRDPPDHDSKSAEPRSQLQDKILPNAPTDKSIKPQNIYTTESFNNEQSINENANQTLSVLAKQKKQPKEKCKVHKLQNYRADEAYTIVSVLQKISRFQRAYIRNTSQQEIYERNLETQEVEKLQKNLDIVEKKFMRIIMQTNFLDTVARFCRVRQNNQIKIQYQQILTVANRIKNLLQQIQQWNNLTWLLLNQKSNQFDQRIQRQKIYYIFPVDQNSRKENPKDTNINFNQGKQKIKEIIQISQSKKLFNYIKDKYISSVVDNLKKFQSQLNRTINQQNSLYSLNINKERRDKINYSEYINSSHSSSSNRQQNFHSQRQKPPITAQLQHQKSNQLKAGKYQNSRQQYTKTSVTQQYNSNLQEQIKQVPQKQYNSNTLQVQHERNKSHQDSQSNSHNAKRHLTDKLLVQNQEFKQGQQINKQQSQKEKTQQHQQSEQKSSVYSPESKSSQSQSQKSEQPQQQQQGQQTLKQTIQRQQEIIERPLSQKVQINLSQNIRLQIVEKHKFPLPRAQGQIPSLKSRILELSSKQRVQLTQKLKMQLMPKSIEYPAQQYRQHLSSSVRQYRSRISTQKLSQRQQQQQQYQQSMEVIRQYAQPIAQQLILSQIKSVILGQDNHAKDEEMLSDDYLPIGLLVAIWKADGSKSISTATSTAFLISKNELITCHHALFASNQNRCRQFIFIPGCKTKVKENYYRHIKMQDCLMRTTFQDKFIGNNKTSQQFVILHMNVSIRLKLYLTLRPGKLIDKEIRIVGYPESKIWYNPHTFRLKIVNAPRKDLEMQYVSLDYAASVVYHLLPTAKGMSGGPILSKYQNNDGQIEWGVIGIHTQGRLVQEKYNQGMLIATDRMTDKINEYRKELAAEAKINNMANQLYSCLSSI